jgi:hypothetical protein
MKIAFGITTAPRPVAGYLRQTLESLRIAGISEVAVFNDQDKALGPYRNFKRAVRVLLQDNPEADSICVFQDDIAVADCLGELLAVFEWPADPESVGVVSLYTALPHQWNRSGWFKLPLSINDPGDECERGLRIIAEELKIRGDAFPQSRLQSISDLKCMRIYEDHSVFAGFVSDVKGKPEERWFRSYGRDVSEARPWSSSYGACAYLMPRESARLILEGCQHPESKNKTDIHVAETCVRLGLSIWMHAPSYVEHIGERSTLHDFPINDFRRAGKLVESTLERV